MGARFAMEDGLRSPSMVECLHYGFYGAAKFAAEDDPSSAFRQDQISSLIRTSLFDIGETAGEMAPGTLELVWEKSGNQHVSHQQAG